VKLASDEVDLVQLIVNSLKSHEEESVLRNPTLSKRRKGWGSLHHGEEERERVGHPLLKGWSVEITAASRTLS
jgi:hypothetical protein